MRNFSSEMIVNVLRKDYPDIDLNIRQKLERDIPERLDDLGLIPNIISAFLRLKEVSHVRWVMELKGKRVGMHKDRELLLSVIILFYHPEKLLRITDGKTRYGVIRAISREIDCPFASLKMALPYAITAFRAYKEFKDETYRLYELIKLEHNFFQYGKEEQIPVEQGEAKRSV